ncbi:HTH-type transcriptional regulator / antitoxin HigA [Chitinophaga costaii]|uniref:HTH-type transcriptional regulator / antitoxin HigA n=1 Tax=Chitinophaga costaii TaxID=1335309 RepID=A0A1C4EQV3_9BACT|nr:helix-turn-helix domain-containing protein [Chitinophaga costaii]PUZ22524.1 transcriptional regulator [Chitinophaga costaii]SCC45912.1 HTH-type transcriptional regulator / antitoxin HigA [Chitinophaga costaii]
MDKLPFTVIKTEAQYNDYCTQLEALVMIKKKTPVQQDTIELITLLIEKWDEAHNSFSHAGPIEILRYLMQENNLRSVDLVALLGISKSLLSDILNYRRGLSKDMVRKLAGHFKVSQEVFNRPYALKGNAPTAVNKPLLEANKGIAQHN